jgi:hypothetical protein
VTLLEILETSAEAFWRLPGIVGQLLVRLENGQINHEVMKIASGSLGELNREVDRLKLESASRQLARIKKHLFEDNRGSAGLEPLVHELHLRILEELDDRYFLLVPTEAVGFYWQKAPLFGPEVEQKFPAMTEDISEAGKCLALNRNTASVFHLMRVMEIATQHLRQQARRGTCF